MNRVQQIRIDILRRTRLHERNKSQKLSKIILEITLVTSRILVITIKI